MTVQMIRTSDVSRPTPEPLRSSVLDHATVVTIEKFGLRNKAGMWPSYNCLDLLTPTVMCPEPFVGEKVFTTAEWQSAFEFAVYGGVQCQAVGLDKNDQKSEIKRVFELSEGKGIEQALLYARFAAPESGEEPLWGDAPVDLTPSTAISLPVAVALLEGHAAANYVGVPTLHMPRAAAVILTNQGMLTVSDGLFYTKTGAKVAAGGGYDDPDMLASGQWTLFATGEVHIERSSDIDHQLYVIPGDGSGLGSGENQLADNTVIAFAERMFRVTIDCYTAQITATVWA